METSFYHRSLAFLVILTLLIWAMVYRKLNYNTNVEQNLSSDLRFIRGRTSRFENLCATDHNDSNIVPEQNKSLGFPAGRILTRKDVYYSSKIFPKSVRIPVTVDAPYLIKNSYLCSQYLIVKYVIMIHSSTTNFEFRKRQRKTWAKASLFKGINSVTIFILGKTESKEIMEKVAEENEEFGDIIQGDFIDVYANLTLKAVMGMRWLAENCQNAEYVIKADDDTFINIFRVKNVFAVLDENPKQLICSVIDHPVIIRDSPVRLSIPMDQLPGLHRYPTPVCFGFAVFFKYRLAVQFFKLAKSTPFFKLDDVYFYGFIASKIEGLTWRRGERFERSERLSPPYFAKFELDEMLVGSAQTFAGMRDMWNTVVEREVKAAPNRNIKVW